ncbi:hypothetical protein CU663_04180 [Pseudomonas syringae pv. actinidifoliorum]|nr:hypothetical protein [Pseudomonas syringae pv. actinidifoliorum]
MFITLRGSRTMDRQDCEHFGLSHDKEKRGDYANTFNAGAKMPLVCQSSQVLHHETALRL